MSKYDGPSYFKKNHPKIKPLKNSKKDAKENKKVSWADQDNYFKNDYEETIPEHIQTRTAIQEKALDYMQTPSTQFNNRKKFVTNTPSKEKSSRFRSKHIPASLQHLEGWKTNTHDHTLILEVKKRLAKETSTYLLFEENLAPEVAEAVKIEEQEKSSIKTDFTKEAQINEQKQSLNDASQKKKTNEKINFDQHTKEKAERVQEELNQTLLKPNTGLHRSLSKIIAEDQEALKSGKNNLGSLFSDKD